MQQPRINFPEGKITPQILLVTSVKTSQEEYTQISLRVGASIVKKRVWYLKVFKDEHLKD